MTDHDMLARLAGQLSERGADWITIRALIEEASELGASRAMARIGLSDAHARDDLRELRVLLGAWRDAKRSALRTGVDWLVKGVLALLLFGMAMRLGFGAWLGR